MATSKKPTPANKRKAAAPKKVAAKPSASTARAMDIIPKNRVRPTTTSRPVITTSTPAVADNTLTSPSSAPALQIKRRQITINPPQDSEISKDDVMPNLAASAPEAAASADPVPAPSAQGVSVGDLIAKRKEKVVVTEPSEEVAVSTEEGPTPGTTPELPVSEPSVDDPAAAEAARLLSDAAEGNGAPVTEVAEAPVSEEVAVDEQVEAESAVAPVEVKDLVQDTPVKTSVIEDAPSDAAPKPPASETPPAEAGPTEEPKPAEPAAADSVGEILKEEQAEPQEHSQALKDEIKTMNEKGTTHHELYGGQPVIVVHKEHGPMSAVTWVLWFFLCLGIALVIVNFLLDAGFIVTNYKIPHTNIL